MLGSFPCYPGAGNNDIYKDRYFYCTLCSAIVHPCEVSLSVLDRKGECSEIIKVMRCKIHRIKGLVIHGAITSLWVLEPQDEQVHQLQDRMVQLCSRVREFDIFTILSAVLGGLLILTGLILSIIVAGPIIVGLSVWVLPTILIGIGLILCICGKLFNYMGKKHIKQWVKLAEEYKTYCQLRQIQQGSNNYVVITDFPPTCSLGIPIEASLK
ncbi:hypothetical protein [Candidatus Chlamydia sanziniae]|uniref:Uncharacterized protein n=1 Tax=Candidatus Chlamydia sanziniae TaxID=1806891 RepID=A0A1A9HU79_9CHLA|nr:hypothetical protein [Candidatus Chlamydia sanziniae]ANH78267.1 hypothetical protein Cs308_0096 [Candidatus Chlamydia sanziniae]